MNNSNRTKFVGIDVCKEHLDVFAPCWSQPRRFDNNPTALRKLFGVLGADVHIVCEATGGCEALLLAESFAQAIPISRVNPRQVRDFARAKGLLAKTDQIDARVLSEFGEVFKPRATTPPTPVQMQLSAAIRHREVLVRQLTREKIALGRTTDKFVLKDLRAGITSLQKRLTRCDQHILALIDADEELRQKRQRLEQVKGVGPGTASLVPAELPELGTISGKQAAALVGLAPMNRDSGKGRGRRTTQGGRGQVRRGLYMPAMNAVRFNPILKEFYQRLIDRNKPHHVAIVAVMRKLICLLNKLLSTPNFSPQ